MFEECCDFFTGVGDGFSKVEGSNFFKPEPILSIDGEVEVISASEFIDSEEGVGLILVHLTGLIFEELCGVTWGEMDHGKGDEANSNEVGEEEEDTFEKVEFHRFLFIG